MMYPARTTRPNTASTKNRKAFTKGRANIGIRCPRPKPNWEFGETVCSNKLVDQRGCRRGCTAMLVQGCAIISDKLLPQFRIAQQIANSMSQLSRRIDWIVPPPTRSSVANDAHRRIVHKSARRRPTSCAVNFPTRNDANGRNRFCAHALHFDALRDERAGDENRLLSHFLLSLLAPLDRCIGKRGAGRD